MNIHININNLEFIYFFLYSYMDVSICIFMIVRVYISRFLLLYR